MLCVNLGWVAKWWETSIDFHANLILTKVSHHKSTQVASGQTESQVDTERELASTWDSDWPEGLIHNSVFARSTGKNNNVKVSNKLKITSDIYLFIAIICALIFLISATFSSFSFVSASAL